MIKKISFLILVLLLGCIHKEKGAIEEQEVHHTEPLNFEHHFKSYNHKDSMDIDEWITSDEGDDARLENPETFLYMDTERQIRLAIFMNDQWRTWMVYDAKNKKYYAKIYKKNFDGMGNLEIMVQSKYGLAPQSTFGSSYYGSFQIWNPDSVKLYFEMENYSYSDDMGRNGDQTYISEHLLNIEVKEKQIFVNPLEFDLDTDETSDLEDEYVGGEYILKNGIVIKMGKR